MRNTPAVVAAAAAIQQIARGRDTFSNFDHRGGNQKTEEKRHQYALASARAIGEVSKLADAAIGFVRAGEYGAALDAVHEAERTVRTLKKYSEIFSSAVRAVQEWGATL